MPSASDRTDFAPPQPKGALRALGLAIIVHLLLIAALTWGVNWKNTDESASSFAAELWTAAPQEAVPLPTTPPAPQPEPPPPAPTPVTPPKVVETPVTPNVDIALEQEKKRKLEERKLARDKAEKEKQRLLAEAAEQEKADKAEKDRKARLAKVEKAEKAEKAKQAAEAQAARDAKDTDKQKVAQANAKAAADKQRQDNLKRLQGLAGATGETDGNSSSRASSGGRGSSTTYGAIVRAAIRPNVIFTDDFTGNPMAKIEVRLTLDGTVISQRLVQSSGNKGWDEAAANAILRTRVMPKDVDGRIPDTTLILEMRPRG